MVDKSTSTKEVCFLIYIFINLSFYLSSCTKLCIVNIYTLYKLKVYIEFDLFELCWV